MARNRKNQSPALLPGPVANAVVICLFIVVCCVGYVWQKKQISELSRQIRAHEKLLADQREKNDKLKKQLAVLLSPPVLEARAKELRLGLIQPDAANIWRLTEPVTDRASLSRLPQAEYAAGDTGSSEP
jgi:hypothetical protein